MRCDRQRVRPPGRRAEAPAPRSSSKTSLHFLRPRRNRPRIKRQTAIVEAGGAVVQETRDYDGQTGTSSRCAQRKWPTITAIFRIRSDAGESRCGLEGGHPGGTARAADDADSFHMPSFRERGAKEDVWGFACQSKPVLKESNCRAPRSAVGPSPPEDTGSCGVSVALPREPATGAALRAGAAGRWRPIRRSSGGGSRRRAWGWPCPSTVSSRIPSSR